MVGLAGEGKSAVGGGSVGEHRIMIGWAKRLHLSDKLGKGLAHDVFPKSRLSCFIHSTW